MNIIPDWTLVGLQVLPFFAAIAGLHFILFRPMLAYLHARREATVGERKQAEALQEKATLKLQQWEAALARAQQEVADFRAAERAKAQAVYVARVASARAEADRQVQDEVAVLQGEAALAREQVGRMSRSIAADMAASTLGRSLGMEA